MLNSFQITPSDTIARNHSVQYAQRVRDAKKIEQRSKREAKVAEGRVVQLSEKTRSPRVRMNVSPQAARRVQRDTTAIKEGVRAQRDLEAQTLNDSINIRRSRGALSSSDAINGPTKEEALRNAAITLGILGIPLAIAAAVPAAPAWVTYAAMANGLAGAAIDAKQAKDAFAEGNTEEGTINAWSAAIGTVANIGGIANVVKGLRAASSLSAEARTAENIDRVLDAAALSTDIYNLTRDTHDAGWYKYPFEDFQYIPDNLPEAPSTFDPTFPITQ